MQLWGPPTSIIANGPKSGVVVPFIWQVASSATTVTIYAETSPPGGSPPWGANAALRVWGTRMPVTAPPSGALTTAIDLSTSGAVELPFATRIQVSNVAGDTVTITATNIVTTDTLTLEVVEPDGTLDLEIPNGLYPCQLSATPGPDLTSGALLLTQGLPYPYV